MRSVLALVFFLHLVLCSNWTADDVAKAMNSYQKLLAGISALFNAQNPPQVERAIINLLPLMTKDINFLYVNGNNATQTDAVYGRDPLVARERVIAQFVDRVFMYPHPPIVDDGRSDCSRNPQVIHLFINVAVNYDVLLPGGGRSPVLQDEIHNSRMVRNGPHDPWQTEVIDITYYVRGQNATNNYVNPYPY